ncbi:MAG TPA: alanine racemase [Usitatibacter sp.]|nr:alanine racemase [Usitatibacter sp.]
MLQDIDTPALLLDEAKVKRNCERMRSRVQSQGATLRPHVKTAKNVEVAQLALGAETGPITVSTVREAEYFFDHGFRDILYAVGIVPGKVRRLARLAARGARVTVIVDSVEGARALRESASLQQAPLRALIEIDSDGHRAGIRPGEGALFQVAEVLGPALDGVMTHAGDSYNCASVDEIREVAERERRSVVESAGALRARGFASPVVSVGSTPTATFALSFAGVSEVRAGVHVFHDLVMAGLGVCALDDIAVSVLASVIGHQREKGWILTDAGWMALSRDRGTAKQKIDQGYGLVCDADCRPLEELVTIDANQEHGIVARRDGGPIDFARYPVGSLLRILPNHACATAAQHAEYHVIRDGEMVATWERFGGW